MRISAFTNNKLQCWPRKTLWSGALGGRASLEPVAGGARRLALRIDDRRSGPARLESRMLRRRKRTGLAPTGALTWSRALSLGIRSTLGSLGLERPTQVQAAAIPAALSGSHVFLTAQTGSGKTLGYILPLIELLQRDHKGQFDEKGSAAHRSQALIVVPTRELALQVVRVWEAFTAVTGLVCAQLTRCALRRSESVAAWVTPAKEASAGNGVLWNRVPGLRYLVLDEADALFSMQRHNQLAALPLKQLRGGQMWFAAATVTRSNLAEAERLTQAVSPSRRLFVARDDGLHRPPLDARVRFEQVEHPPQKVTRLLGMLRGGPDGLLRDGRSTLIFCNSIQTCRFVQYTLHEHGILGCGVPQRIVGAFMNGAADVLICSDLAARGLDWPFVRRVICFDAPLSYHHFLHRVGRLRQGGICTILLRRAKREQALAECISERLSQRTTLAPQTTGSISMARRRTSD
ncbi:DEAD (Asp-Glu-Ala-Asp) box polypeptide 41 [Cyanidiococcus yangmingshanensis]|uniref:ATP-dependent RNA helicase n=1 Tax=Cyanidiococcus yangmingshanensis TaxID=2690220 RepID=A0A7J7IL97_9RHOD|nr:DEAD (Asp-Glu-Ala-Asp) box polypeptide 41 [Cyanidiococcus yangmingshanensis]